MIARRGYLMALVAGALVLGGCNTKTGVVEDTPDEAVVPPGAIPADPNASLLHPTVPKDQPAATPAATPTTTTAAPTDSTTAGAAADSASTGS